MSAGKLTRKKILVVHGPNLNLHGEREPEIYGTLTLKELNLRLKQSFSKQPITLKFFQSNHEGEIIDFLHSERNKAQGVVINPAAYTHTSYAIRDAIAAIQLPTVEVHLSDIKKREPFRSISVIRDVCVDQVSGLGWKSYEAGIQLLLDRST